MITIDLAKIDSDYVNWQALIAKALAGERVSICQSGQEVAYIDSSNAKVSSQLSKKRVFGSLQHTGKVPEDTNWGDDIVMALVTGEDKQAF